jgi:hypothetical protein
MWSPTVLQRDDQFLDERTPEEGGRYCRSRCARTSATSRGAVSHEAGIEYTMPPNPEVDQPWAKVRAGRSVTALAKRIQSFHSWNIDKEAR